MAESTPAGALVEGSVTTALRRMALPMALGMVFMILVNLIDTWWVARLGTAELAAMTFTFPVVGLIINVAFGLMIGTSTAVARAIGAGESGRAARLTTHALFFSVGAVALLSTVGLATQDFVFGLLGADAAMRALIEDYMTVWYAGAALLVVPLIANGALRATGDARSPMIVMMLAAVVNAVLDPLLIFGWGPIPGMGLTGAAIATLVARFVGMVYAFWVLMRRTELVALHMPRWGEFTASVRAVLSVGIPASITNALGPVAVAIITGIIAGYGPEALAAYGIGARLDMVVLIAPMALGSALSPFVGQNWGAHLTRRVAEGIRRSLQFSIVWCLVALAALVLLARPLASLFTDDPAVSDALNTYLTTMPLGYAPAAAVGIASASFNAVDRAIRSTWLSLLRTIVLAVPAAWIGGSLYGLDGVFLGLVAASLVASIFGVRWLRSLLDPEHETDPGDQTPIEPAQAREMVEAPSCPLDGLWMPLMQLEGVHLCRVRGRAVGIFVGDRELGHVHADGRLDMALPIEVGNNLVGRGLVEHHPLHEQDGWYRKRLTEADDIPRAVWLMQLARLLYLLSRRGEGEAVTRAELDAFVEGPKCAQCMVAAARRWQLEPDDELAA